MARVSGQVSITLQPTGGFKNKNKGEDRNQETVKLSGLRGLEFRIWSSKCKSFSLPSLGG